MSQIGLTFLMIAYPGCLGKEAVKWVSVLFLLPIQIQFGYIHFQCIFRYFDIKPFLLIFDFYT